MLTIIPVILTAGVVSVLVTFTELLPADSPAATASFHASRTPGEAVSAGAVHCGAAMELVTPAVGPEAIGYSFGHEDGAPIQLPPVWRCGCGFQLDAWIRSPYAHVSEDHAFAPGTPRFMALSA